MYAPAAEATVASSVAERRPRRRTSSRRVGHRIVEDEWGMLACKAGVERYGSEVKA